MLLRHITSLEIFLCTKKNSNLEIIFSLLCFKNHSLNFFFLPKKIQSTMFEIIVIKGYYIDIHQYQSYHVQLSAIYMIIVNYRTAYHNDLFFRMTSPKYFFHFLSNETFRLKFILRCICNPLMNMKAIG